MKKSPSYLNKNLTWNTIGLHAYLMLHQGIKEEELFSKFPFEFKIDTLEGIKELKLHNYIYRGYPLTHITASVIISFEIPTSRKFAEKKLKLLFPEYNLD